jgi:hypothetical protein
LDTTATVTVVEDPADPRDDEDPVDVPALHAASDALMAITPTIQYARFPSRFDA